MVVHHHAQLAVVQFHLNRTASDEGIAVAVSHALAFALNVQVVGANGVHQTVFGQRAREELVAEFGSGMVMIELGLDAKLDPNNKAYLKFWGEKLSNASDKELIGIIQDCDKAANIIFDKGLKLDRKQAKEQGVNFSRFNGEEYTQHLAEKHAKEKEKGNNKTTKWKASSTKSNARSSYRSKKY